MTGISYSAIVLDEQSRERLINRFKNIIPEGWYIIADHMTINLGEIAPEYENHLGITTPLTVNDIAIDDKVIAVGVSSEYKTVNADRKSTRLNSSHANI